MKVHIISHTHWDREWYLSAQYFKRWLPDFFSELFALLERRSNYCFVLDGATIIIHDWIHELKQQNKFTGTELDSVRKFVQEGRILLGPYYVQLDWYLAGGETLVRNMLLGLRDAEHWGARMKSGWLMDNFGLPAQSPQIHRQFGIDHLFVWRGIRSAGKQCELRWVGSNGDEQLVLYMIDSYRNAMRLLRGKTEERIEAAVQSLLPFSNSKQFLLMNGYDQELEPEDIVPILGPRSEYTVQQSTPTIYAQAVRNEIQEIPTITGEQNCGREVAVFPGIHSARIHLKQHSLLCEYLLQSIAEPLATLSWLAGGEYPADQLMARWRKLLRNHPHDSICGVSVDPVHYNMEQRLTSLEQEIRSDIICSARGLMGGEGVYLFNPSPFVREEIITIPNLDFEALSLPEGCQYDMGKDQVAVPVRMEALSLTAVGSDNTMHVDGEWQIDREKRKVTNDFFTLEIKDDGSLDLYDHASKQKFRGLHIFEDVSDAGDCYNYSPCHEEVLYSSQGKKADIAYTLEGQLLLRISIGHVLDIPQGLVDGKRSKENISIPIDTQITVHRNSPLIRCKTTIRNRARDHRLSIKFQTGLASDKHHAGTIFEAIERSNEVEDLRIEQQSSLNVTAREVRDYGDHPMDGWVAQGNGRAGLLLISRDLREYQCNVQGDVLLHLFRSVGWIAQSNLESRSGDAGPNIMAPDAWMLRDMQFEYAFCSFGSDWKECLHEIDMQLLPPYQFMGAGSSCTAEQQILRLDVQSQHGGLRVSACKRSENGEALLLRMYNPDDAQIQARLQLGFPILRACKTNLSEQGEEAISPEAITMAPKEIASFLLYPHPGKDATVQQGKAEQKELYAITPERKIPDYFQQYPIPNAYTQEYVGAEEAAIQKLQEELLTARQKKTEGGLEQKLLQQHITLLERELLEKELSALLLRHRLAKGIDCWANMESIDAELKRIGDQLNQARINKRVADFFVLMPES